MHVVSALDSLPSKLSSALCTRSKTMSLLHVQASQLMQWLVGGWRTCGACVHQRNFLRLNELKTARRRQRDRRKKVPFLECQRERALQYVYILDELKGIIMC